MHEKYKISEAEYFFQGLLREHRNSDQRTFAFELSAFLSASRSVLLYAHEEAKQHGKMGCAWYEKQMARDTLLAYMRDKRDANIHSTAERGGPIIEEPIKSSARYAMREADKLVLEEADGSHMILPIKHQTVDTRYEFPDKPGKDVIELARRCVELLKTIVEDGLAQGVISG